MHTVVKEESVTDFIDREAQNPSQLCEAGPSSRLLYYVEEETVVFWEVGFDEP